MQVAGVTLVYCMPLSPHAPARQAALGTSVGKFTVQLVVLHGQVGDKGNHTCCRHAVCAACGWLPGKEPSVRTSYKLQSQSYCAAGVSVL